MHIAIMRCTVWLWGHYVGSGNSSFLFINAVSPVSVSELLDRREIEFFDVVNPRFSLLSLKREEVITQDVVSLITAANDDDAKEILFAHLTNYVDVNALITYCDVIIGAQGFPKMQQFGAKLKEELQQGGWWSCVLVCTYF